MKQMQNSEEKGSPLPLYNMCEICKFGMHVWGYNNTEVIYVMVNRVKDACPQVGSGVLVVVAIKLQLTYCL